MAKLAIQGGVRRSPWKATKSLPDGVYFPGLW